ncbi:MAG: hypothetical protein LAT61_08840 [Alcanivorax sp.]|nr:hypothetical protein [Alcanivorax sp.]
MTGSDPLLRHRHASWPLTSALLASALLVSACGGGGSSSGDALAATATSPASLSDPDDIFLRFLVTERMFNNQTNTDMLITVEQFEDPPETLLASSDDGVLPCDSGQRHIDIAAPTSGLPFEVATLAHTNCTQPDLVAGVDALRQGRVQVGVNEGDDFTLAANGLPQAMPFFTQRGTSPTDRFRLFQETFDGNTRVDYRWHHFIRVSGDMSASHNLTGRSYTRQEINVSGLGTLRKINNMRGYLGVGNFDIQRENGFPNRDTMVSNSRARIEMAGNFNDLRCLAEGAFDVEVTSDIVFAGPPSSGSLTISAGGVTGTFTALSINSFSVLLNGSTTLYDQDDYEALETELLGSGCF